MTEDEALKMVGQLHKTFVKLVEMMFQVSGGDEKGVREALEKWLEEGKQSFIMGAFERALKKSNEQQAAELERLKKVVAALEG